jgi:DNA-binding SARP family transcriptional activator
MSNLKLYLPGPPPTEVDGELLEIKRGKALALLVYLAATGESQRRDTLATLLRPNSSQSGARAALRRDLSILNKALGGNWLAIKRETIGLRIGSDFWLDTEQFQQHVADCTDTSPACHEILTRATDLYRNDFLTGFTLPDCPDFDEWQFSKAEGLRQELASALGQLVPRHSAKPMYSNCSMSLTCLN